MGLSGRKVKQRIPADPRNLTWADDAAKFGSSYLSKFGWDSSKGLGASGDGRTSHIKVSQKLDMLGIGAAHRNDPDGIAWKQNKDFEILLKRLNEASAIDSGDSSPKVEDGDAVGKEGGNDETEKKRKRDEGLDDVAERNAKKIRRKGTEGKKSKRSTQLIAEVTKNTDVTEDDDTSGTLTISSYIPRHRAHRARAIASKNMASKSTAAISEILGIAPTPSSSTTSGSGTPSGELTSPDDKLTLETLTTSTKSVADYFRDKLLAKSSTKSGTATPLTPLTEYEADAHDAPRGGLGSFRPNPDKPKFFSSIPSIFSAPKNRTSVHEPPSDILSVETQVKSTSEDIALTDSSPNAKVKKRRKEKDPSVRPDKLPAEEGQKRVKSNKKTRKEKKCSQDNNESC